jgi:predicted MFS family arabinose efflux permease
MDHGTRNESITQGTECQSPFLIIGLSTISGALEYYDFVVFAFFVKIISELFFPSDIPVWVAQLETFGIFGAGYVVRPLGGIVVAHFGDLLGRKKMFMLTVLLMTVSSLGIAMLPTYSSIGILAPVALLLLRMMQGAAVGGEVPGSWTFVAEHVLIKRTGVACGVMSCGIAIGLLLGALTAMGVNGWMSLLDIQSYGWRLPFFAGGCAGLISVYLRRYLSETPIFRTLQERKGLATRSPIGIVVREHPKGVALSFVLGCWLSATNAIFFLMTPTLLPTVYHVPLATALQVNTISVVGIFFGMLSGGVLIDRWGASLLLILGNVLLMAISYLLFTRLSAHPDWLLPLYLLMGAIGGAVSVTVPYLMVGSFPAFVRFTGVSLSYNLASAIMGGLTPVMIMFGLRFDPLAHLHYFLVVCAVGILTGVAVLAGNRGRLMLERT